MRALVLLAALLACGCGESSSQGSGGTTSGGAAGAGGSGGLSGSGGAGGEGGSAGATGGGGSGGAGGGVTTSGDCTSDTGCPGGKCMELLPGGFRVCQYPVDEATSCKAGSLDECCASSECSGGKKCYETPTTPSCGGAAPQIYNVCATDACTPGQKCADNPPSVCMPGGFEAFKVATCVEGGCLTDADCTAEAGGICAPIHEACCNSFFGLYCVYPGDGCRGQHDCASGKVCTVELDTTKNQKVAHCVTGNPACPP